MIAACDSRAPIVSGTLQTGATYTFRGRNLNLPRDSLSLQRTRPILLDTDSEGDLVVIELKLGKAPCEAAAQLLDRALWVSAITYGQVPQTFVQYYGVLVNAVLFQHSADRGREYLVRTWFRDPMEIADRVYRGPKET